MLENPFVWHTHVTTYDAGPDQTLRLSSQLKLQQEAGELQLAAVGAGYRAQLAAGMAFVITRTQSVIHRSPLLGEKIAVRTWPRGTRGSQFFRCYEFESEETGERLISSISSFALVDPQEHKLLRPSVFYDTFGLEMDLEQTTDCPEPKKWAPPVEPAFYAQHLVSFSQTDWNQHLNNTMYADLLTDYMPGGAFGKWFSGFSIEFMREALPGELLDIRTAAVDNEVFVCGSHERGECFRARAQLKWRKAPHPRTPSIK